MTDSDSCSRCGHNKTLHNTDPHVRRFADETCIYIDSEGPCLCTKQFLIVPVELTNLQSGQDCYPSRKV